MTFPLARGTGKRKLRTPRVMAASGSSYALTGSALGLSLGTNVGWHVLKQGGGGWNTYIDIAADGTMVTCGDVFGAFVWNPTTDQWEQLIATNRMPAADVADTALRQYGSYAIRIAPSNTNIFYMHHRGYIYKTTDKGLSFTRTGFPRLTQGGECNNGARMYGPRMAVCPTDANRVITTVVSDADAQGKGAYLTTNGGTNWTQIATIPNTTSVHGYKVIWVSGTEAMVSVHGSGVYRSTDSGATFSLMSGSPTEVAHWDITPLGTIWATHVSSASTIYKCPSGGSWSTVSTIQAGGNYFTVACNPSDSNNIVLFGPGCGNTANFTTNGGTSWFGAISQSGVHLSSSAPEPTWPNVSPDAGYLSMGNARFHPSNGKIYLATGIGIFTVPNLTNGTLNISSQTRGIEGMQANYAITQPNALPLLLNHDKSMWRITDPNTYPSDFLPPSSKPYTVIGGWGGEYAATDPAFVAVACNYFSNDHSCFSSNAGATWTRFNNIPARVTSPGCMGGNIAVSTPLNMIWMTSQNGGPYRTSDGGQTWIAISIAGVPDYPATTGWSGAYYNNDHMVCADRVTPNKFYMINSLTHKSYTSSDGGVSWTANSQNLISSGVVTILGVPGHAGWVILSKGYPDHTPPMITKDSGVTWTNIPGWDYTFCLGYGKQVPGGFDPTVFMIGSRGGVEGIWYSTNIDQATPTWTSLGGHPGTAYGFEHAIAGDWNTPIKCYVGMSFGGWMYYQP